MISVFHKMVFGRRGQRDTHGLGIIRVRQDVIKLRAPELHGDAHGLQTADAERIARAGAASTAALILVSWIQADEGGSAPKVVVLPEFLIS